MMLVNWHLGLAERERHWQAHHLLGHDSFLESTDLPALVIGDFNDWRNTLAAGPFAARLPARHRSALAFSFLSGLPGRGIAGQGVHSRQYPGASCACRSLDNVSCRVRSLAAGDRFSPEASRTTPE